MTKKQYFLTALLVLFLAAFCSFVWPTRYMYLDTPLVDGDGAQYPIRVDRLTGETQFYEGNHGWSAYKKQE